MEHRWTEVSQAYSIVKYEFIHSQMNIYVFITIYGASSHSVGEGEILKDDLPVSTVLLEVISPQKQSGYWY